MTRLAAGLAVFRAAGSLGFGVTGGTFFLRGAGCEKHHGRGEQNSGRTNHELIRYGWNKSPLVAVDQLLAHHRWWRWWGRSLLAGAKDGGSRDECKDSDFHVCVWVLTSLLSAHPPDSWQRDFSRLTTTSVFANSQMHSLRKLAKEAQKRENFEVTRSLGRQISHKDRSRQDHTPNRRPPRLPPQRKSATVGNTPRSRSPHHTESRRTTARVRRTPENSSGR